MKCKRCGKNMTTKVMDGQEYYVCDDCMVRRLKKNTYHDITPKPKMSICLLISLIIGVAYIIYSIVYWTGAAGSGANTAEQAGSAIATVLVFPHLVVTFLAVLFNALGLFLKKRGFALTGAILYAVAMVLFPMYFFFVIIEMILSFVGFAKMKKY